MRLISVRPASPSSWIVKNIHLATCKRHSSEENIRIVQLALDEPGLSACELAAHFTDTANYLVSETSVYRLLKAHHVITSLAYIATKAADDFKDKTTAPNQLWQTNLTYLKVTGWSCPISARSWMTSHATSSHGS